VIASHEQTAQLLSRSCTTGWTDWVWGELWLSPSGIARISLGWSGTRLEAKRRRKRGGGPTVSTTPIETRSLTAEDRAHIVGENRRNRWIPREKIQSAQLRRGLLNGRLAAELVDGTRTKLLWLRSDPAFDVLGAHLGEWLGDALQIS
jgi:hypothetical protein